MAVRMLFLAAALVLGGCANSMNAWNAAPGATREQVIASAGQPTRVVPLPGGGQRLQYSRQPVGHDVFMVDLDASGRVVRARNVMTAAEFHRIEVDKWTREDIEREFGRPAWVDSVASWRGPIWTYRWKEVNEPMFYWVYFDPQGIVRRAHPGIEHINAPNDRD